MSMIADHDDAVALREFVQNGDEAAFQRVVERHVGMIRATCRRVLGSWSSLADDAVQTVLLQLYRHAGTIRDQRALAGWLHTCALTTSLKVLRAETRRRRSEVAVAQRPPIHGSASSDWQIVREHVDQAIAVLSPAQKEAVVRHFLLGKPHGVVAAELGCTVDAAKMRISHALDKMRAVLQRRGIFVPIALAAALTQASEESAACSTISAAATKLPAPSLISARSRLVEGLMTVIAATIVTAVMTTFQATAQDVDAEAVLASHVRPEVTHHRVFANDDIVQSDQLSWDSSDSDGEEFMPAFARCRHGDVPLSREVSDATMTVTARLIDRQGKTFCVAYDSQAQPIFTGFVDTGSRRQHLPRKIGDLFGPDFIGKGIIDQRVLRDVEADRRKLEQSISVHVELREHVPWLVATRAGKELFSGPIDTPAQRQKLPPEVAERLGDDFFVRTDRSKDGEVIGLHINTGDIPVDPTAKD